LWLSPVQVAVVPIGETALGYARDVQAQLKAHGLRASLDDRNERMQAKIRDAQMQQVPYMAVVGGREAQARAVAVRHRREGDLGVMPLDAFLSRLDQESARRA
jgi:threonyl-tRNA synthetase